MNFLRISKLIPALSLSVRRERCQRKVAAHNAHPHYYLDYDPEVLRRGFRLFATVTTRIRHKEEIALQKRLLLSRALCLNRDVDVWRGE